MSELEVQERMRKALAPADTLSCAECIGQLDQYISAQLNNQPYLEQFPSVVLHLDRCLDCAVAYAHLYELETIVLNDALPQPKELPNANMSFLGDNPRQQKLLNSVKRLGNQWRLQFSEQLLDLLQPPVELGLARSAEPDGKEQQLLYKLDTHEINQQNVPFSLKVFEDPSQTELCNLEVAVEFSGHSWPDLGGLKVTLTTEQRQESKSTDAWGIVLFTDLAQENLKTMMIELSDVNPNLIPPEWGRS